MSYRKAIDEKCRSCVYDDLAAGTWRQQTTLCSVTSCALWPYRPRTKAKIPDSVLRYYGIDPDDFEDRSTTSCPSTAQTSSSHQGTKSAPSQTLAGEFGAGSSV